MNDEKSLKCLNCFSDFQYFIAVSTTNDIFSNLNSVQDWCFYCMLIGRKFDYPTITKLEKIFEHSCLMCLEDMTGCIPTHTVRIEIDNHLFLFLICSYKCDAHFKTYFYN